LGSKFYYQQGTSMILRLISKLKYEVIRFTLVGMFNAGLTFVTYFLLLKIFKINYLIALIISWVLGVVFSYILNFSWVFKPEQRMQFKERFIKYFSAYLISFALNLFALTYIVEYIGFDPFYVQTALIPLIVIINFATSKFWSLRPKNPKYI
jgi:putative flippase GtrA